MPNRCGRERLIAVVMAVLLHTAPLVAQKRATAPKKPAAPASSNRQAPEPIPTFDTLLSADNYRIYCEVRSIGELIQSPALNDLLNPIMKLSGPPKEFRTMLKWLNAHADALSGSRLLVAGWPSQPKLPTVLIAIEFASVEEAQKFDPELRRLMPTLLPTPTLASSPDPDGPKIPTSPATPLTVGNERLPYYIKQAGTLVLISEQPFTISVLTPPGSKPLVEDQNFVAARSRFATEPIFLYVDLKSIEREEREQRQKYEKDEQKRTETEAANPPKLDEVATELSASEAATPTEGASLQPPVVVPQPSASSEVIVEQPDSSAQLSGEPVQSVATAAARQDAEETAAMFSLSSILFGGETKWPEAVGAAIAFEGDSYVVRALILNADENKASALPFIPQFVSGPPLLPASPNVFPADIELFVSASLDYQQIYEGTIKAFANAQEIARKSRSGSFHSTDANESRPDSPFGFYEKKLGLKIKDDLLPLLGNELALALLKPATPSASARPSASPGAQPDDADKNKIQPAVPEFTPIIAIAVKDREAVSKLLPKIIESLGFKGANLFAQTEKRDGTEITTYANVFSYAFVGDFLVVSPDPSATRHVVDSYLNNQTLSSDSHFRNFTRWQPRQVQGQVYVAPELMHKYTSQMLFGTAAGNKALDFINGLNPVIDPVTYALANEGSGPLHELHVPKNLLMLMIAGMSKGVADATPVTNESYARGHLRTVMSAEATYAATEGKGRFGTLEQLVAANLLDTESLQKYGYRIEIAVSEDKFEAVATPLEYGQSGRISYFIDETGILRGGDHGGGPASVADEPAD